MVDVAALGKYKKLFVGYRDEATGRWVHLPVVEQQFDRPVLTVEVDHFSTFGGGADGEMEWGWTLTFNEATVGNFDGGLGYSYPLQVVPGRAGLTPQLSLSYNSRRMDGVLSWVQSDWTGLGWTVDTVEILRKGVERCWQDNWICYKNEFVLVLNGTTYELKPQTAGQNFGRYHTEDEQFLYIERRNAAGSNGSSQNTTGEYWIVRTKDGTEYELGKTGDAEQVFGPYAKSGGQPAFGYVGTHPTLAAFRWRVDQVTDPHGNHIDYTYYEETKAYQCANEPAWPSCQGVLDDNSERASYLDRIKYNHRPSNGQPGAQVIFQRAKRGSDVADLTAPRAYGQSGLPLAAFWQRHYLQRIQVQASDAPTDNWGTLREYRYTDSPPFRVQRDRREWSGSSGVIAAYRFYDGLGRPIQTKQERPNNQQAVQHTTYNAQGKVAEEYIPYAVMAGSAYTPLDPTKPKTTYTYDALGRPTQLTHPDGRTVDTAYKGRL